MTTQTTTKYNKLLEKIFWFMLPLIISLLTYLVVCTFTVQKEVEKVAVSHATDVETNKKMWDLILENNKILHSKADQEINEKEHKMILDKLDMLETSVQKISKKVGFLVVVQQPDTLYLAPYKELTMVDATINE